MWYIDRGMAFREFFKLELTNKANIFFYFLSLSLHLFNTVLASFLLQSFDYILIFLYYLQQFSFSIGFIQGLLLYFTTLFIHSSIRSLASQIIHSATFCLDRFYFFKESLILSIDLEVSYLFEGLLLQSLIKELKGLWTLLSNAALESSELLFMNFPRSLNLFVEAQLITHWDRPKHSAI